MKKLLIQSEKEYLNTLETGDSVEFSIKKGNTVYTGTILGRREDGVFDIKEPTTAPAGNCDIDIIVPEEKLYAC